MGGLLVALGLLGAFVAYAVSGSGSSSSASPGQGGGGVRVPSDLPQRLETFLASNPSPEQIEAVARDLDAAGLSETAAQLRTIAAQRRAAASSASSPASGSPNQGPAPSSSPAAAAPSPSTPPDRAQDSSASPPLPPPPLPPGPAEAPSPASPSSTSSTPSSPSPARPAAGSSEREPVAREPGPIPDTLEGQLERAGPTARDAFARAMREASAADLRVVAREVRRQGFGRISDALERRATELDARAPATATAPTVATSPPAASAPEPAPPEASSSPQSPSEGELDLSLARRLAPQVAEDIRTRSYSYSRQRLRDFQRAAGLTADGQYGGASRGALVFFGVRDAPRALFAPTRTVRYQPPARAAA